MSILRLFARLSALFINCTDKCAAQGGRMLGDARDNTDDVRCGCPETGRHTFRNAQTDDRTGMRQVTAERAEPADADCTEHSAPAPPFFETVAAFCIPKAQRQIICDKARRRRLSAHKKRPAAPGRAHLQILRPRTAGDESACGRLRRIRRRRFSVRDADAAVCGGAGRVFCGGAQALRPASPPPDAPDAVRGAR